MANENEKSLKERQNDLEELRKKIGIANLTLKKKEHDISNRLVCASLKEKVSFCSSGNAQWIPYWCVSRYTFP